MCTDVIRLKVFWGEGATTEKGKKKMLLQFNRYLGFHLHKMGINR